MLNEIGKEICETLTMAQVAQHYGVPINRANFAKCPFHQGDNTPSLKIYDHSFYCFGCGKGGDVITFVRELLGLNFRGACEELDRAFCLGLVDRRQSFSERRRIVEARAERINAEKSRERAEEYHEQQFKALTHYRRWLLKQPDTPETQRDIDYIDRLLDQEQLITFDAVARVQALLSKHPNGGEILIE